MNTDKNRAGDPIYDAVAQWAEKLDRKIRAELSDPHFPEYHHGRPIGYNTGCRGPLCTKSQRDRIRDYYPARKPRGAFDPMLEQYLETKLEELRQKYGTKKRKPYRRKAS